MNDRVGERKQNKIGEYITIVEYINTDNIRVSFETTGEIVNTSYRCFKTGSVKSHFIPTVYGVGIVGTEKTWLNGRSIHSYDTWKGILRRCYNEKERDRNKSYGDCTICEEWIYYSNFKKWYKDNYYDIKGEKMALDKDILVKNNRIYSPTTCVFVPEKINSLFKGSIEKSNDLPTGVQYVKNSKNKYKAKCSDFINGGAIVLKYCKTIEEAFNAYKIFKENYIKQLADEYKPKIPEKLYKAMYKYEINITD